MSASGREIKDSTKPAAHPPEIRAQMKDGLLVPKEQVAAIRAKLNDLTPGVHKVDELKKMGIESPYDILVRTVEFKDEDATRKSDLFFNVQQLGAGSFGQISLLYDPNNPDVPRVLKSSSVTADDATEFKIANQFGLAHARFYDKAKEDSIEQIIMNYVPGITLNIFLDNPLAQEYKSKKITSVSDIDWIELINQLLDLVQKLHSKSILHLDLKDLNILIDPETGKLGIVDFGSAVVAKPKGWQKFGIFSFKTATATPGYAAPETLKPEDALATNQSDIFSLGVVFANILGLAHPYQVTDLLDSRVRDIKKTISGFSKDFKEIKLDESNEKFKGLINDLNKLNDKFLESVTQSALIPQKVDALFDKYKTELANINKQIKSIEVKDEKEKSNQIAITKKLVAQFNKSMNKITHTKAFEIRFRNRIAENIFKTVTSDDIEFKENPKIKNKLVLDYALQFINTMLQKDQKYRPKAAEICIEFFNALGKFYQKYPEDYKATGVAKEWEKSTRKADEETLKDLLKKVTIRLEESREKRPTDDQHKVKDAVAKFEKKT